MRLVLIYSHLNDPVTRILLKAVAEKEINIICLSINDFLKNVEVFDQFDESNVDLSWHLPSGVIIKNNCEFYLINRVFSFPDDLFLDFAAGDQEYAREEFRAYLKFALTSFPYGFGLPGAFGLCGNRYSLPRQWNMIKSSSINVEVPEYYLGDMEYCKLTKNVIYSNPHNYYYWRPGLDLKKSSSFSFERPSGIPVIASVVGNDVCVYAYNDSDNELICDSMDLVDLSNQISCLFNLKISEILFFVDANKVAFGVISNLPLVSKRRSGFSYKIVNFFSRIQEFAELQDEF